MTPKPVRLLIGAGLITSAGIFAGAASVLDQPHETTKKPPAAAKPASKPVEIVQDRGSRSAPSSGHEAEPNDHAAEHAAEPPADTGKRAAHADEPVEVGTYEEALKLLQEGNTRWADEKTSDPNTAVSRRRETAEKGQKPFATILTCADSRVPVERVFDRGVGELFVVRVAGNVVGPDCAGTIEYGAEHLHVPLLVIMGHTRCGAVGAAAAGGDAGGNVGQLVEKISPAVERTKKQNPGLNEKDLAAAAVRENVWQSIFDLIRGSESARTLMSEKKLVVVGAVYDVATGKVEWLGQHPWQDALVDAFTRETAPAKETAHVEEEHH